MESGDVTATRHEVHPMEKPKDSEEELRAQGQQVLEFGGLRFDVAFRAIGGATLRGDGKTGNERKRLLRFDGLIKGPPLYRTHPSAPVNLDPAAPTDAL